MTYASTTVASSPPPTGRRQLTSPRCGLGAEPTVGNSNGVVREPDDHLLPGKTYPAKARPSVFQRIACEPRTDLFCYHWVVKAEYDNERVAREQLAIASAMPDSPESAAAVAEAEAALEASRDNRLVAFGHLALGALSPLVTAAVFGVLTGAVISAWHRAKDQAARIKELEET